MLPRLKGSYGADIQGLVQDRTILTDPEETKRRRTIRLLRDSMSRSWGFTLQTYGIRNKQNGDIEVMSYVDYVEIQGAAWTAGMRRGDVILSVNGESVESLTHMELVQSIQGCRAEMRLVVLFENCCRKVELHERYLNLKKIMSLKIREFRTLEEKERLICKGLPMSCLDTFRRSTCSSVSSDWDIYSEITSPTTLNSTPSNQFVFRSIKNQSESDVSSESVTLESSFVSEKWQENASTESIVSSSPSVGAMNGERDDAKGFLLSGQSDASKLSETSDQEMNHMYNITRCAAQISEASRCSEFIQGSWEEIQDGDGQIAPDSGSMTNLIDDSGVEMRSIKASKSKGIPVRTVDGNISLSSSASSTSSSCLRDGNRMKKGIFYIESDSEDSALISDIERSISMETNTAEFRTSDFLRAHSSIADSFQEKEEDEMECRGGEDTAPNSATVMDNIKMDNIKMDNLKMDGRNGSGSDIEGQMVGSARNKNDKKEGEGVENSEPTGEIKKKEDVCDLSQGNDGKEDEDEVDFTDAKANQFSSSNPDHKSDSQLDILSEGKSSQKRSNSSEDQSSVLNVISNSCLSSKGDDSDSNTTLTTTAKSMSRSTLYKGNKNPAGTCTADHRSNIPNSKAMGIKASSISSQSSSSSSSTSLLIPSSAVDSSTNPSTPRIHSSHNKGRLRETQIHTTAAGKTVISIRTSEGSVTSGFDQQERNSDHKCHQTSHRQGDQNNFLMPLSGNDSLSKDVHPGKEATRATRVGGSCLGMRLVDGILVNDVTQSTRL